MSSAYDIARAEGYTDDEIKDFMAKRLSNTHPKKQTSKEQNRDPRYEAALKEGYSPEEIDNYLSSKKSGFGNAMKTAADFTTKAARLPVQFGIGMLQRTPEAIAYDVGVAPLASKDAQHAEYRKNIFEDIERLAEQKATGVWDEQDQQLYDNLVDQIKHPEKAEQFVKTTDITTGALAEKAGLRPEGTLEKAARWSGFIKDPRKLAELRNVGLKPKEIFNIIRPSGKEASRGLGAGAMLELAEAGQFGPLGTMAASIVGDIIGGGIAAAARAIMSPRKALAHATAFMTPKSKLATQAELIRKAREEGITLDVGSITNSKTIKFIQSTLAASGLTGKALDDLRSQLTSDVINSYKKVADGVGQLKFQSNHAAGQAFIDTASKLRGEARAANRGKYEAFENAITSADATNPTPILAEIQKIRQKLQPGSFKSGPQKKVLDVIEKILPDLVDAEGQAKPAKIQDLWNLKKAIQDEIDFDTVGGLDKLLSPILKQIDKSLIGYGATNPKLSGLLSKANKAHSETVKTFQEGTVGKFLKKGQNPDQILNTMDSVKGIREVKKALAGSSEGRELYDNLRRAKLEEVFGQNMYDSTTQQLKTGTFAKILEKGNNREVIHELVGNEAFRKLQDLQLITGRLAESSQKFLNASQSATKGGDLLLAAEILRNAWGFVTGNPYPLIRTGTAVTAGWGLSKLFADKKFLTYLEDAVIAKAESPQTLDSAAKKLADYVKSKQETAGASASATLP